MSEEITEPSPDLESVHREKMRRHEVSRRLEDFYEHQKGKLADDYRLLYLEYVKLINQHEKMATESDLLTDEFNSLDRSEDALRISEIESRFNELEDIHKEIEPHIVDCEFQLDAMRKRLETLNNSVGPNLGDLSQN